MNKKIEARCNEDLIEKLDKIVDMSPYFKNRSDLLRSIAWNYVIGREKRLPIDNELYYQEGTKLFKKVSEE